MSSDLHGKYRIRRIPFLDIFDGEEAENQLGKNKKSVAFMVRLQPFDTTFTDHDLELVSQKIITNVKNATGALLRA